MTDTPDTVDTVDAKTVATLKARAALAGWELIPLPDGAFIASRWGMHRDLAHAAEAARFLDRVSTTEQRAA